MIQSEKAEMHVPRDVECIATLGQNVNAKSTIVVRFDAGKVHASRGGLQIEKKGQGLANAHGPSAKNGPSTKQTTN